MLLHLSYRYDIIASQPNKIPAVHVSRIFIRTNTFYKGAHLLSSIVGPPSLCGRMGNVRLRVSTHLHKQVSNIIFGQRLGGFFIAKKPQILWLFLLNVDSFSLSGFRLKIFDISGILFRLLSAIFWYNLFFTPKIYANLHKTPRNVQSLPQLFR